MIRCNNKELWKNKESFDPNEQKKNKQTKLNEIIQKLPQDFIKLIQKNILYLINFFIC